MAVSLKNLPVVDLVDNLSVTCKDENKSLTDRERQLIKATVLSFFVSFRAPFAIRDIGKIESYDHAEPNAACLRLTLELAHATYPDLAFAVDIESR